MTPAYWISEEVPRSHMRWPKRDDLQVYMVQAAQFMPGQSCLGDREGEARA